MKTLNDLFSFIFQHDKTVVYGNLGRQPWELYNYIKTHYPTFDVQVYSKYYPFQPTHRIKTNGDTIEKCDLLIYLEPAPNMVLLSHKQAARMVVFTSHLLVTDVSSPSAYVSFWFSPDPTKDVLANKRILSMQDCSVQASRGDLLKTQYDSFNIQTVGVDYPVCDTSIYPGKPSLALNSKTFVIADLTNTTSTLQLYLYLWEILDYLKINIDMIEKWVICFPEKRMKQYHQFIQECRNKLLCKTFQYGNVTNKAHLVGLTPFYQHVSTEVNTVCETKQFCRLNYIMPKSETEAYTCSLKYNLTPLAGSVYLIE